MRKNSANLDQTTVASVDGLDPDLPTHQVQVSRVRHVTVVIRERATIDVRALSAGHATDIADLLLKSNHNHMTWLEEAPVTIGANDGELASLEVGPSHQRK